MLGKKKEPKIKWTTCQTTRSNRGLMPWLRAWAAGDAAGKGEGKGKAFAIACFMKAKGKGKGKGKGCAEPPNAAEPEPVPEKRSKLERMSTQEAEDVEGKRPSLKRSKTRIKDELHQEEREEEPSIEAGRIARTRGCLGFRFLRFLRLMRPLKRSLARRKSKPRRSDRPV